MCANNALSFKEHLHSLSVGRQKQPHNNFNLFCNTRVVKSHLFCDTRVAKLHLFCDMRVIKLHLFGDFVKSQ